MLSGCERVTLSGLWVLGVGVGWEAVLSRCRLCVSVSQVGPCVLMLTHGLHPSTSFGALGSCVFLVPSPSSEGPEELCGCVCVWDGCAMLGVWPVCLRGTLCLVVPQQPCASLGHACPGV